MQVPAASAGGEWTRTARDGGETWIYNFTVGDAASPPSPGNQVGREADRGTTDARREAGSAAADGVDIEAQRAYLRTASGGKGSQVGTPAVGQTVYLHLDYRVTGADTVTVSVRALLDGTQHCAGTSSVTPGSWIRWCSNSWVASTGAHTLQWDLDYDGAVTETNESNNSAAVNWTTAVDGVDIEAQRAYLRTASGGHGSEIATPAVGQAVYFHLDYRLSGPGAVTVDARALLDGTQHCASPSSVTPGSWIRWCNNSWVATTGVHTLQWDLDYDNAVAETTENNNSASTNWSTAETAVDIEAQRAYLRTAAGGAGDEVTTPAVGQTVYVHLDYRVAGPAAVSVSRRAKIDEFTQCSGNSSVAPGGWVAWCNSGWKVTAGMHTLQWDLDYDGTLSETTETNNTASANWTSAPAGCTGDCTRDNVVTVDELYTMLSVAAGTTPHTVCELGDRSGDHTITVDEVLAALNHARDACP